MNYKKQEIKKGINLHLIKANNFKTDLISVFITTPLTRENVTKNAIIPMILRKGSKNLENIEEINKALEEMYGAEFNCGIDKTGDNQVLKFYLEEVDNKYLPIEEDLIKKGIDTLLEIVFEPKIENNAFKAEYVEAENKASYAYLRCQEEMFKGKPFGLYKYGYIEDIEKLNPNNLYEHYKKLIAESKIDIFISGDIEEDKAIKNIQNNQNIKNLNERNPK